MSQTYQESFFHGAAQPWPFLAELTKNASSSAQQITKQKGVSNHQIEISAFEQVFNHSFATILPRPIRSKVVLSSRLTWSANMSTLFSFTYSKPWTSLEAAEACPVRSHSLIAEQIIFSQCISSALVSRSIQPMGEPRLFRSIRVLGGSLSCRLGVVTTPSTLCRGIGTLSNAQQSQGCVWDLRSWDSTPPIDQR
jgi:hypothetical protein